MMPIPFLVVSGLGARRAVLQQTPLGWQDAAHGPIVSTLPQGQSGAESLLLAAGSACIWGELMPFYSV